MTVNTDVPAGPQITERREMQVGGLSWTVNEFDDGRRFMLVGTGYTHGTQFSVQFDAEEWRAFQDLVSPPQSALGADGT